MNSVDRFNLTKMADGKKNRFSALAGKDKCEETECQLFEKTVAEAVEEALNKENDQKLTVSAKQPAKGKKKTGAPQLRQPEMRR